VTPTVAEARRRYVLSELGLYWPKGAIPVAALLMPSLAGVALDLPPRVVDVLLPPWSADVSVGGALLVPEGLVVSGPGPAWRRVDWLSVAFWYMNGLAEQAHEGEKGSIGSYSTRLPGWDGRLWDHAWVNRIALFLRRWAAHVHDRNEEELLGRLPAGRILVSHDLDAVTKTVSVRGKATAFQLYNAARRLRRGRLAEAAGKLRAAGRFLLSRARYDRLEEVCALDEAKGISSHCFVYARLRRNPRGARQWLFDPSYRVEDTTISSTLKRIAARGHTVGLHPSFDSFTCPERLLAEKRALERALDLEVRDVRQHWLRFSWRRTWQAQAQAGLGCDMTLGFNDRPGFRCGAALRFHPWDLALEAPMSLEALPLVCMDSHFYDYSSSGPGGEGLQIGRWVEEVLAVHGQASVVWHPHTLSPDFGWNAGFHALLALL
jgi:hypothetical protein